MSNKRAKSERDDTLGYDRQKAKDIFAKKLADDAGGRRANSQMRRDAELIVTLLEEGDVAGARMSVFSSTFEELFDIDRSKAVQGVGPLSNICVKTDAFIPMRTNIRYILSSGNKEVSGARFSRSYNH